MNEEKYLGKTTCNQGVKFNLPKWKKLWNEFSKREYGVETELNLYATDCGGYDTTNEVMLKEIKGKLYLIFLSNISELKSSKEIGRFEVKIND